MISNLNTSFDILRKKNFKPFPIKRSSAACC